MPRLDHSKTVRFLVYVGLVLGAASCSQRPPASEPIAKPSASIQEKSSASIRELIAKTYGLDEFGQVEAIRYTWNAQFPGVNVSRSWVWETKAGRVSYEGKDKDGKPVRASYLRSQLSNQPENVKNDIEPAFVNDNYWLLFPLHAYWDSSAAVQDKGTQPLPQGNGSADLVSVKYPSDGGYTPGDTWDLYLNKDSRIDQFVYHRGGSKKPSVVIATWEGYKKAGPLLISTDHNGTADGNALRIFISDLAVKVTGSKDWIIAE